MTSHDPLADRETSASKPPAAGGDELRGALVEARLWVEAFSAEAPTPSEAMLRKIDAVLSAKPACGAPSVPAGGYAEGYRQGVRDAAQAAYKWWDGEPEDAEDLRDHLRALTPSAPSGEGGEIEEMPACDDRQPYGDDLPGYMESDDDWVRRNPTMMSWLIDNHAAIRARLRTPPTAAPAGDVEADPYCVCCCRTLSQHNHKRQCPEQSYFVANVLPAAPSGDDAGLREAYWRNNEAPFLRQVLAASASDHYRSPTECLASIDALVRRRLALSASPAPKSGDGV